MVGGGGRLKYADSKLMSKKNTIFDNIQKQDIWSLRVFQLLHKMTKTFGSKHPAVGYTNSLDFACYLAISK